MEQTVWKLCFYRPIEQFRARIAAAAAGGADKKEALQKVEDPTHHILMGLYLVEAPESHLADQMECSHAFAMFAMALPLPGVQKLLLKPCSIAHSHIVIQTT